MTTYGFIGVGNMGGAVAKAVIRACGAGSVRVSSRTPDKARAFADAVGGTAADNLTLAKTCDYLFLGVKPQVLPGVLEELAPVLAARERPCVLVSMAAGITIERIHSLTDGCPTVRIMPNTPVGIGSGLILYTPDETVTPEQEETLVRALCGGGRVDRISEDKMDVASAVSGCGPAFVCQFLEGLADGGVACGLPRDKANANGAQMLLGTAALMLESGQHPGVMKDQVCSPGGSTIQGVRVLEERALRGAVMDAVIAAFEKNQALR